MAISFVNIVPGWNIDRTLTVGVAGPQHSYTNSDPFAVNIGDLIFVIQRPVGIADSGGVVDCHDNNNSIFALQNPAPGVGVNPPAGWTPIFTAFATQASSNVVVTTTANLSFITGILVAVYRGVGQIGTVVPITNAGNQSTAYGPYINSNPGDWIVGQFNSTYTIGATGVGAGPYANQYLSAASSTDPAVVISPTILRMLISAYVYNQSYQIAITDVAATVSGNLRAGVNNPYTTYVNATATQLLAGNPPINGFSIVTNVSSMSVAQGGSSAVQLNVVYAGGFSNPVTIVAQGLPVGVSFSVSPNPTTNVAILTFTAAANATLGPVTVNVTGSATASNNANVFIQLTVVAPTVSTLQIIATGGV